MLPINVRSRPIIRLLELPIKDRKTTYSCIRTSLFYVESKALTDSILFAGRGQTFSTKEWTIGRERILVAIRRTTESARSAGLDIAEPQTNEDITP